jgi:hypothetical protein
VSGRVSSGVIVGELFDVLNGFEWRAMIISQAFPAGIFSASRLPVWEEKSAAVGSGTGSVLVILRC